MKFYKLILVCGITFLALSGCSKSSDSSDDKNNTPEVAPNKYTIKGKLVDAGLTGAIVTLSTLKNSSVALGQTESLLKNSESEFVFTELEIDRTGFYLLKACEGTGKNIYEQPGTEEVSVNNLGCFHAIATGDQLVESPISISIFTDAMYLHTLNGLANISDDQLLDSLNVLATNFIGDFNDDSEINYKDILSFDPRINFSKHKIDYTNVSSIYLADVFNDSPLLDRYKSLLAINRPQLEIEGGNTQALPLTLKANFINTPLGSTSRVYLNGQELTNDNSVLKEEGIYIVESSLQIDGAIIGTEKTRLLVTSSLGIDQQTVSATETTVIHISENESLDLANTEVIIPASINNSDIIISANETSSEFISENLGYNASSILKMEPEGTIFQTPVVIKLQYDPNLTTKQLDNMKIARYSKSYGLDYLSPLHIDYNDNSVYFETDHFSFFGVTTPFDEKPEEIRELELQLLQEITGDYWTEKELIRVLEPNDNELTLYDFLEQLEQSKRIFEFIEDEKYIEAVQVLYPDGNEVNEAINKWEIIEKKFRKLEKTYSRGWPKVKFGDKYTVDLKGIYKAMGFTFEKFDSQPYPSYTPFAPVKMADYALKELSRLYEERKLFTAFTAADIQGGWYGTVVSDNEGINKNIGVVYNKYSEYRADRTLMETELNKLIDLQKDYINNVKDPYLSVSIPYHKPFGSFRNLKTTDTLSLDVNVKGYGISGFDINDLSYKLINTNDESYTIIGKSGSKYISFELRDEEIKSSFFLEVKHEPSNITYQYHGLNLNIEEDRSFNLKTSTAYVEKTLDSNSSISMTFDENLDEDSVPTSISIQNKDTLEVFSVEGFWSFASTYKVTDCPGDDEVHVSRSCGIFEPIKSELIIQLPPLPNGRYWLFVKDTLTSESSNTLNENYTFNFISYNDIPETFEVTSSGIDYSSNNRIASLNFEVSNTEPLEFVTYKYSLEGYGSGSGGVRSVGGCPGVEPGVNICGGFADQTSYKDFTEWTISNSTSFEVNSTFTIEFCDKNGVCLDEFEFKISLD